MMARAALMSLLNLSIDSSTTPFRFGKLGPIAAMFRLVGREGRQCPGSILLRGTSKYAAEAVAEFLNVRIRDAIEQSKKDGIGEAPDRVVKRACPDLEGDDC